MLISSPMKRNGQVMASYKNMGFYPPAAIPCVICCEYIFVYQDDIYIESPTAEAILNTLQNKYKLPFNPYSYLGAKYSIDPGGTMICQLRKYLEKFL